MPKRTNYFQQVVHHIYRQLASTSATITESAMLCERSSSIQREVDILVEQFIAGHRIRIGIECRDRSSKDDITWVDSVIGKYQDLDIQKVILVSSSGFSPGAVQKAQGNNIETHTLAKINELDIKRNINLLKMSFIQRTDEIQGAYITTDPQLKDGVLDPKTIVYKYDGEIFDNLNNFAWRCYAPYAKDNLSAHITQNMDFIFPVESSFEHEEVFQVPLKFPEPYCYIENPIKYYIISVTITIKCRFIGQEKAVDNYWYHGHQVAVAHITDKDKILIIRKQTDV